MSMNNIKIYCDFISFDLYNEKNIELYVNFVPTSFKALDTIRFVYLIEPHQILDLRQQALVNYKKTYDFLLTHDESLLRKIDGSYLMEFGSCWIKDFQHEEKEYSVSFLCGGKTITSGHHLRQGIWNASHLINVPKNFFISGNYSGLLQNPHHYPTLGNRKHNLFRSMFHLCIENVKNKNFFTEKLIDCLYAKTIPIYYGCPNIGDWFDTRGFIIVDNVNDIIEATNNLTAVTYMEKLEYLNSNYLSALKFVDINIHVKNKLESILNLNT